MIRQTEQRQPILETVGQSHDHPTAAQVFGRVRQLLPDIGFATVYRNLRGLSEDGLIREIRVGEVQYDRRTDWHDHAVCGSCGVLVDLIAPLSADAIQAVLDQSGFRVAEFHTEVFGLCSDCR